MSEEHMSGLQKAAILLIALGPEKSAMIFKHLKEEEIELPSIKDDTKEESDVNDEKLEEPVLPEPKQDVLEDFEPKQEIKLSTYDELEHLEDEKYNLSKKDYNDRLAILLNQINVFTNHIFSKK